MIYFLLFLILLLLGAAYLLFNYDELSLRFPQLERGRPKPEELTAAVKEAGHQVVEAPKVFGETLTGSEKQAEKRRTPYDDPD